MTRLPTTRRLRSTPPAGTPSGAARLHVIARPPVRARSIRAAAWPLALLVATAPVACAQRTDTTVATRPDVRVQVQNFAGSITVRAWDRPAVRVVAGSSRRDEVRIRGNDAALTVSTFARGGAPAPLDCEITVPTGAALDIGGTYTEIRVDGVRGSVSASTVQGAVALRGGDGVISLKSVEGAISIDDARGRIDATGVNKGITLRGVTGDITAETVNGSILLDGVTSSEVEAVTVNGRVTYDGTINDRGRYRFGSHNGTIAIAIPPTANATISVVTYEGSFSSRFGLPVGLVEPRAGERRRTTFALGNGSARVEAESFQGNIVLARPGDLPGRER